MTPGTKLGSSKTFTRPLVQTIFAALICASPGWGQSQGLRDVTVDATRPVGTLKPLRGVNGAPDMSFLSAKVAAEVFKGFRPMIVSDAYRKAAINLVRTHDSMGAGDVETVDDLFPFGTPPLPPPNAFVIFRNLAADPSDPASYNFGPTDQLIGGIEALQADVIFRLGREASLTAEPPKDLNEYGQVIRHIVLHYNKGWDNGFHYHIRYWEVWNEPDLGKVFWRGSPDQYYALYLAAARAIKAADPSASLTSGTHLGPYEIISAIGAGTAYSKIPART
jgi:xylan 1,4-beta-xylosidase